MMEQTATPQRMSAKTFAAILNGREYTRELTTAEAREAEHAGLLVVFGYSDDNVEFRGVFDEEAGAWDGGEWKFRTDKMRLVLRDDCKDCLSRVAVFSVKAEWAPKDLDTSWRITASVPFEPFDIMDDGELFCRGCVIETSNSEMAEGQPKSPSQDPQP